MWELQYIQDKLLEKLGICWALAHEVVPIREHIKMLMLDENVNWLTSEPDPPPPPYPINVNQPQVETKY